MKSFSKQNQRAAIHTSSNQQNKDNKKKDKKGLMERENILTIPNFLCLSRILMSPYIAHLIIHTGNYPWALAAFGYAGITDLVNIFMKYCVNLT